MALTTNKAVLSWIDEMVAMTKPDRIVWIDGSESQLAQLREQLTPEMILMTWYRKDRVAMTFRGLEMAIQARKRLKGLSH